MWTDGEVPFVPTPVDVADRMLEMARVTPADVVYDLGSGDGAIVIRAAQKFGARGVGIEIDADLVRKAQANASREKVEHLTDFRVQDALSVDVSEATVVTLYMLPEFNAKLRPILDRQLKSGARVISHDFPVEGWVPDHAEWVKGDFFHDHTILLFEIR
jgi:cyclopropane fatty-acyl-phospholipid synthase-like methyltransferase